MSQNIVNFLFKINKRGVFGLQHAQGSLLNLWKLKAQFIVSNTHNIHAFKIHSHINSVERQLFSHLLTDD
jgi:hypothetical protein